MYLQERKSLKGENRYFTQLWVISKCFKLNMKTNIKQGFGKEWLASSHNVQCNTAWFSSELFINWAHHHVLHRGPLKLSFLSQTRRAFLCKSCKRLLCFSVELFLTNKWAIYCSESCHSILRPCIECLLQTTCISMCISSGKQWKEVFL